MSKTIFKSSSIEQAEAYYQNIHINPEQKEKINSFAQILSQYLPISERALMGFLWRVLLNIQKKYHIDFAEEGKRRDVSLAERMGAIQEIFTMLKEELTRILISQEQEPLLDKAIGKAINFYKKQLGII
ncbi:MAG: hypothetical protein ACFFDF_08190 [Candidatus Odinarchaeota archaeon]